MSQEVAKANNQIVSFNPSSASEFLGMLANDPLKEDVLVNEMAGDSSYIPIAVQEQRLDELFLGLWQTKNFRWQVIANEIVGSIELGVYHPVLKEWIWREGAASVMIQQKKNSDITDISAKHKNTLVKDFPHLKASCLKNACISLGRVFGRDLNRGFNKEMTDVVDQVDRKNSAKEQFAGCNSKQELNKVWAMNPDWHKIPAVRNEYKKRVQELNPALNG